MIIELLFIYLPRKLISIHTCRHKNFGRHKGLCFPDCDASSEELDKITGLYFLSILYA